MSITYNGTVQQLLYATNSPNYPGFIRLVNNTAETVQAFALIQTDAGALGSAQIVSNLAPNSNGLYSVATIISSSGISAPPPTRVGLLIMVPPPETGITQGCVNGSGNSGGPGCAVSISQFFVNPSGDVNFAGSGFSP